MKKVLSTVAALGLVAGLASTAAAVEFQMSGKYLVEGAYLSSTNGNGAEPSLAINAEPTSDAYLLHTFEMRPTMKVNDKISVMGNIRLADDTFWGSQDDLSGTGSNVGSTTGDMYVHHLYMDYASPIGKIRVGRVPAGTFGYAFMDKDGRSDRIAWWPTFLEKPFSTLFYYEKLVDNQLPGGAMTTAASDADSSKYVGRLYYTTDTAEAIVHYGVANNQTAATRSDVKQEISLYGKVKSGNMYALGEVTHYFGEQDNDAVTTADRDYDSWAGVVKVGGKFDALSPWIAYAYAQGQDLTETAANGGDIENVLGTTGTGDLFQPLYILTGRHTGIMNNDIFNGYTAGASQAGMHAVVVGVDYAVSKELTLHGGIGWAQADEILAANQDEEYGWEYNVGAAYKLLDNLTYDAHFGYLDTGDFFEMGTPATTDSENIFLVTHSLTMTF
ncbi:MAG: hypothetical protein V1782_06210 [Pseudomonadota bacterium]